MEEKHQPDVEGTAESEGDGVPEELFDKPKQPASRGIPSKERIWLHDLRKLRDEWKYHQNVRLELDQILHLIFPQKYQEKYYEISLNFMKALIDKTEMYGDDLGQFIRDNNYSKATFYNVVLPRLKKVECFQ